MKTSAIPVPQISPSAMPEPQPIHIEIQSFTKDAICSYCGLWRSEATHSECTAATWIEDNS